MTDALTSFLTSTFRFNLHGLLCVAAGFFNLIVGVVVLSKDYRSPTHRAFFCVNLSAFFWIISWGMLSLVRDIQDAYFWDGISYLGSPFISPCVYLFSSRWRRRINDGFRIRIAFILAALVALPLFLFTEEFVIIKEASWGRYDVVLNNFSSQILFGILLVFFFTFAFMAFFNFFQGWRQAQSPIERIQFRNILIAFVIGYTGSVDWFVSAGLEAYPFGFISMTLLQVLVGYNMIRHQLLGINLFLKRAMMIFLIYSLLGLLIITPATYMSEKIIGDLTLNPFRSILVLSAFFGIVLSLGPIIYAYLVRHSYWLRGYQASGLTHELKSPLGSIQGAVAVIFGELDKTNPDERKLKEYAHMIQRNSSRMEEYVADLLSVAKIENEDVYINKQSVNLTALIVSVVETYSPSAREKNILIEFGDGPAVMAEIDAGKIKNVVSNLLSNAIKFSSGGAVQVSITEQDKHAICAVRDQGVGINPKYLGKIFDRFYQVDPGAKGSGIGLAIAKAWVEAHGGKIWAESEGEGKGTTVTFTVPM